MTFWTTVAADIVALIVFAGLWHIVGFFLAGSDDPNTPLGVDGKDE